MSLDATLIGENTAEFMEILEGAYEFDDSARVVEVITIAVVHTAEKPDTEECEEQELSEDGYTFVHYRASESAWHRQVGIIEAALWAVRDRQ